MTTSLRSRFALLASAIALLSVPALRAQTLTFNVDINTAGLSADLANAPFDLDFQLNYGNSSVATDTATLSNFVFTGGTAVGSATTSGTAAGNLGSSVSLTASAAHPDNEFYQQFSSGVTDIAFTARITEPGPDVGTPTEFTAAILDNSLGYLAQINTTAPDTASLVTLNLSSSNTLSDVNTYASVSSADGQTAITGVTATAIPEPSTTAAILGCLGVIFAVGARRFGGLRTA
jgi:hypothetical protein